MTVVARTLVSSKLAENVQTAQYLASGVMAIIDKFTATNVSAAVVTLSVNLTNPNQAPLDANLIVKLKALQPAETYLFPELIGHVLQPGSTINTIASAASAIVIRAAGREVT